MHNPERPLLHVVAALLCMAVVLTPVGAAIDGCPRDLEILTNTDLPGVNTDMMRTTGVTQEARIASCWKRCVQLGEFCGAFVIRNTKCYFKAESPSQGDSIITAKFLSVVYCPGSEEIPEMETAPTPVVDDELDMVPVEVTALPKACPTKVVELASSDILGLNVIVMTGVGNTRAKRIASCQAKCVEMGDVCNAFTFQESNSKCSLKTESPATGDEVATKNGFTAVYCRGSDEVVAPVLLQDTDIIIEFLDEDAAAPTLVPIIVDGIQTTAPSAGAGCPSGQVITVASGDLDSRMFDAGRKFLTFKGEKPSARAEAVTCLEACLAVSDCKAAVLQRRASSASVCYLKQRTPEVDGVITPQPGIQTVYCAAEYETQTPPPPAPMTPSPPASPVAGPPASPPTPAPEPPAPDTNCATFKSLPGVTVSHTFNLQLSETDLGGRNSSQSGAFYAGSPKACWSECCGQDACESAVYKDLTNPNAHNCWLKTTLPTSFDNQEVHKVVDLQALVPDDYIIPPPQYRELAAVHSVPLVNLQLPDSVGTGYVLVPSQDACWLRCQSEARCFSVTFQQSQVEAVIDSVDQFRCWLKAGPPTGLASDTRYTTLVRADWRTGEECGGQFPNYQKMFNTQSSSASQYRFKTIGGLSEAECWTECLKAGDSCKSVTYSQYGKVCALKNESVGSIPLWPRDSQETSVLYPCGEAVKFTEVGTCPVPEPQVLGTGKSAGFFSACQYSNPAPCVTADMGGQKFRFIEYPRRKTLCTANEAGPYPQVNIKGKMWVKNRLTGDCETCAGAVCNIWAPDPAGSYQGACSASFVTGADGSWALQAHIPGNEYQAFWGPDPYPHFHVDCEGCGTNRKKDLTWSKFYLDLDHDYTVDGRLLEPDHTNAFDSKKFYNIMMYK